MSEEKKGAPANAGESKEFDWTETINILHEFLPDDFPEIRTKGEEDRVITEQEMVIYTAPGVVKLAPTQGGLEKISMQYLLLKSFAKEFSGNPKIPFYFANLPFVFVATAFVKQYASKLTRHQMRKILRTFGMREYTLESYIEKYSEKFRLDKVDQFISDFKAYVEQRAHKKQYKFPISKIAEVCQISVEELISLEDDPRIDNAGIIIGVRVGKIIYETRFKMKSLLKKSP